MINDPIEFCGPNWWDDHNTFISTRLSEVLFLSSKSFIWYGLVKLLPESNYGKARIYVDAEWQIIGHDGRPNRYRVGGIGMPGNDRERFVELMLRKYPDHFEWLLFHPEWL